MALAEKISSDRPNILFIVSDDHGWGDLPSNWDNTEVRLPTLDALAGFMLSGAGLALGAFRARGQKS
jgi:hypothetical protein